MRGVVRAVYAVPLPSVTPTERGRETWPPDGYYDGEPCTCTASCPSDCKGQCGCRACHTAYQDFLSAPD